MIEIPFKILHNIILKAKYKLPQISFKNSLFYNIYKVFLKMETKYISRWYITVNLVVYISKFIKSTQNNSTKTYLVEYIIIRFKRASLKYIDYIDFIFVSKALEPNMEFAQSYLCFLFYVHTSKSRRIWRCGLKSHLLQSFGCIFYI